MAQLLVEENFQHLDGQDVELLIEALAELGLTAEPTQPRTATRGDDWALILHWLRDDTEPITGDAVAAALVTSVARELCQAHAAGPGGTSVRGRTLPVRIDIRGRSGELLKSLAMPGAQAKPTAARWWRGQHPTTTDGAARRPASPLPSTP
ncbi:hypothetical protein OG500_36555 [Kitasatospora sp. NBC_01250]|uniref:hypothetical protein n=1 Tax=unclassified Kitasatospora TaxID=2633591 RepID=UPI002E1655C9|nr:MULTISPECIES: hypothetical protein [unclassified Kitasatospora]WSJ71478.1 hypothetical protein OG294_38250 [Kitasatospora sp. NBC_01302]